MSELDGLIERLLADLAVSGDPPVDLALIAQRLGLEVRRARIEGASGMLQIYKDRPVITIELKSVRARARFTLAHELGHYLIAGYPDEVAEVWAAQPSLRDPERFCDRFAESLLLPSDWVTRELGSGPQTLQRLIWAAATAQVSISAASVRVTRVAGWRRTLLRLARLPRQWGLLAVTGLLRPGWRQALEITPGTVRRLEQAPTPPTVCDPLWLPLRLNGQSCYASAQLAAQEMTAIAWVDLLGRRPVANTTRPSPTGRS